MSREDSINEYAKVLSRKDDLDAYLETVKRMEKDITPIDTAGAAASISISLRRIADVLEWFQKEMIKEKESSK